VGAYGLVVGCDNDSKEAQQIHSESLREALLEHITRWQYSGGELDERLRVAIESRRLAIRTPATVYVSAFPLLLHCSNPNCRLADLPEGAQRTARVKSLAARIQEDHGIQCRECGARLEQVPFVRVHRCGRIGEIEPPIAARGRRLRFHNGGAYFRSHWTDVATGENIGRALPGDCPTCAERHAGRAGVAMTGASLKKGDTESFYSQLLQFIALRRDTTDLLAAFRAVVPDPAELGRAIVCCLLGLQDASRLRSNLRSMANEAVIGDPFAAADAYLGDRTLLGAIGASQRATVAALIRGEFPESCLTAGIASAPLAQQALLDDDSATLLLEFGMREICHIDDLAVVLAATGFTRQAREPCGTPAEVPVRLNAFTDEVTHTRGKVPIYALAVRTECILLRLDPCQVLRWAIDNFNWDSPPHDVISDRAKAHAHILKVAAALAKSPEEIRQLALSGVDQNGAHVLGLLHTITHHLLRAARNGSGYDLHSLTEYLLPTDLAALIVLSPRKASMTGGLQALCRSWLPTWLHQAAFSSITCPLDPLCSEQGGSCHSCLRLPRGCETFNQGISRAYLLGGTVTLADGQTFFVRRGFWS
jgi:hypothetical protein